MQTEAETYVYKPRLAGHHQKLQEARKVPAPEPWRERGPAHFSISAF